MNKPILILVLIGWLPCFALFAQSIHIERGVEAAGLWCFPSLANPNIYYYLPNEIRLVESEGVPEFSMRRYINNSSGDKRPGKAVNATTGGTQLSILLEYYSPPKTVALAEKYLRKKLQNANLQLAGALIFDTGKYVLFSSTLQLDGSKKNRLLVSGNTTALDGSKIPFSIHLGPEKTDSVLECLSRESSDIGILFDLTFSGWSESYQAELEVNWSEIYKQDLCKGHPGIPVFQTEVEELVNGLIATNAINLRTNAVDEEMTRLREVVYSQVTQLLFEPIALSITDRSATLKTELLKTVNSKMCMDDQSPSSSGFNLGYQLQSIPRNGKFKLDLANSIEVERHHFIIFQFGGLFQKYGRHDRFFKTLNLKNPGFQERAVVVKQDGNNGT